MVCSFANLVPLPVAENKTKNGKFDSKQLAAYKSWWRRTFRRRDWRQKLLFDPYLIPYPRIILECAPLRRQTGICVVRNSFLGLPLFSRALLGLDAPELLYSDCVKPCLSFPLSTKNRI